MTITFPLTLPVVPRGITLRGRTAVTRNLNRFSLKEQIYKHAGDRWELDLDYPPLDVTNMRLMQAFALSLDGGNGTFLYGDALMGTPRGAASGTPVINGGSQTGKTLVTSGWAASITGILKAGDYLQFGTQAELHVVLADANSDGSGNATFDIWPTIRVSPSNGSAVVVTNPKGTWRLLFPDVEWTVGLERVYEFTLSATEAV